MNGELLRIVEAIHQEKEIDKEIIFKGIESALISAAKKRLGTDEGITILIDRQTGSITAEHSGEKIDPGELGRIAALTAKQVILQKIKEAERDVLFHDFEKKQLHLVTGTVQRFEGPSVVINLGKAEAILPSREQIQGESYRPADRLKLYVSEVKKLGQKVRITVSRTHPELLRALFELEVPEVSDGTIEIVAIAREPGRRAKVAVRSHDPRVDCVGACVGVAGARIKSIVNELNGEKIDIVKWDDKPGIYVANALKPAEGAAITLDEENHCAYVTLPEDQLALAIGKHGQNVRLASHLTGWGIEIESPATEESGAQESQEEVEQELTSPGANQETAKQDTESEIPEKPARESEENTQEQSPEQETDS
jgi:N utilization substance protein A